MSLVLATGCSPSTSAANGPAGNGNDGAGSAGNGGLVDDEGGGVDATSGGVDSSGGGSNDGSGGSAETGFSGEGDEGGHSSRPRVFMALTGSNYLADGDAGVDDQWTYVRQNLDGIWGNNANVTAAEEASLWYKIATRTLITEWDGLPQSPNAGWFPVGAFSGAQAAHPDLVINREAIALYTDPPSNWDGLTIASANAGYVTNPSVPAWKLYKSVFTGWQPQEFTTPLTGAAEQAFKEAKGTFFECPLDGCAGGGLSQDAVKIITAIHAQGDPFVWFASNNTTPPDPDWPAKFKATYNHLADLGLWQPRDAVMIINYGGAFPAVPETVDGGDAPTVTGLLYWAIHQSPISSDQ